MRELVISLACVLIGGCATQRPDQPARAAAAQPDQRADMAASRPGPFLMLIDADTGKAVSNAAVFTSRGVVASVMTPDTWPTRVQVLTEDGARFESPGVLDYQFDQHGVVLLVSAEWRGGQPKPIAIAASSPDSGAALRTFSAERSGDSFHMVEGKASRTGASAGPTQYEGAPTWHPLLGPGVVLNAGGQLVGLAGTWAIGVATDPGGHLLGHSVFTAWRPEVLATLTPGELISWSRVSEASRAAQAAWRTVESAPRNLR